MTAGATGKVTFYDGVTVLGVGTLAGTQASLTTVMLPSGVRRLRAYYQGEGGLAVSSSPAISSAFYRLGAIGLQFVQRSR